MKKIAFTLFLVLLCACTGNVGKRFQALTEPKEDEAIIYFYRPTSLGTLIHYTIKDEKGEKIQTIYKNSYYPYVTKDFGKRKFTAKTEATKSISFDVEAGNTYFVESGISFGIFVGRPNFKLIHDTDKAVRDLRKCNILLD